MLNDYYIQRYYEVWDWDSHKTFSDQPNSDGNIGVLWNFQQTPTKSSHLDCLHWCLLGFLSKSIVVQWSLLKKCLHFLKVSLPIKLCNILLNKQILANLIGCLALVKYSWWCIRRVKLAIFHKANMVLLEVILIEHKYFKWSIKLIYITLSSAGD